MKLLGEQEKDNFAKLNPAQKGGGWKVDRAGPLSLVRSQRHANERMPIYCNQCPPHGGGGSRSKKKAYRVSNELCKRG